MEPRIQENHIQKASCKLYRPTAKGHQLWAFQGSTGCLKVAKSRSPSQALTVREPLIFQMFKLDLEKAEEPEIKLPTSAGSLKKQEEFKKTSTSALLTTPKSLSV